MVIIHSGTVTDEQIQDFQKWRAMDPEREKLCHRLELQLRMFKNHAIGKLPPSDIRRVIATSNVTRRKLLGKTLAVGGVVVLSSIFTNKNPIVGGSAADLQTRTGQRRTITLSDGCRLTLDACTALDVIWKDGHQRMQIYKGEVAVDLSASVSKTTVITTPMGKIDVIGPRLVVGHSEISRAIAIDGPLMINTHMGVHAGLEAGHKASFQEHGVFDLVALDGTETAWTTGMLEVRNRPLAEVMEKVRRYRRGFVRVSERAAELRVSGLFRLDDTDLMFEALSRMMPIKITRYSNYLVMVDRI